MKKNKSILIAISCLLLLVLPLTSCLTAPTAAPTTPTTPADPIMHQSDLAALKTDLAQKAALGSVSALEQRMAQAEGKLNTLQSSAGLTQAQVDAAIDAKVAAAVAALKADQAWIVVTTTTGTGGTVSTSPTGSVTVTATIPQTQIFTSAGSITGTPSNPVIAASGYAPPFNLHIANSSTAIQYVRPIVTLSATSAYGMQYPQLIYYNVSFSSGWGATQGTATTKFSDPDADFPITPIPIATWITNPSSNFPINLSPSNANTTPSPSIQFTTTAPAFNGYGEFQISPGMAVDVLVSIQVATLAPTSLNIGYSISSRTQ